MPALHVQGMHGLGDNLHQRAVIRQLMQKNSVTLETSWPSVYHDLIEHGLAVTRRPVALRTQTKNAVRETEKFSRLHPLSRAGLRVSYTGHGVIRTKSKTILEAMCDATGTSFVDADYSLPVPHHWRTSLETALGHLPAKAYDRPWLVYRPLVARNEWRGSMARNADPACYAEVFEFVRDAFFVISVADLVDGQEWIVGSDAHADLALHRGELVFEQLAALFLRADLVYTSSGFAAVLGPAVGTPTISIVGGYEYPGCHDSGKKFAPYLSLGPTTPCSCWSSACRRECNKTFSVADAIPTVEHFLSEKVLRFSDTRRGA